MGSVQSRRFPERKRSSGLYGSETIDQSLAQKGWSEADFDDSAWEHALHVASEDEPKGRLIEQFQPAIKVLCRYDAMKLGTVNGREIYDFGQNMSGILALSLRGKKGDIVKLYPAEKLGHDGDVDQVAKGWMDVNSIITCVLGVDCEWEDFRMKFTYFAGKVLAVERSNASIELRNLHADAISSAWRRTGSFTCDDERFNQIYAMIERTVEANMLSVHTDCPTIERFAWQEPNHLMAPSIMFMKDGRKLWEKFLMDMRAGQHSSNDYFFDQTGNRFCPGDGLMPSQAPCYVPNVLPVPGMGSFYDRKELTAVFLGRYTETDGVFLQRDGTVAHDPVKAEAGNVQDILWGQHHLFSGAGHVGISQDTFLIPVHCHLIRQQRIQACDLIPSGTDDLAVAVSPEQQVGQHDFPQNE